MQRNVTIISFEEVEEIKQLLKHAKEIAVEVRNGDMHINNNDCIIKDISNALDIFD